MAATRKSNFDTTEPLSVGALAAINFLNRVSRLSHHAEGKLALALQSLSRSIATSRADLKTLTFVAIDARLPVEDEAAQDLQHDSPLQGWSANCRAER